MNNADSIKFKLKQVAIAEGKPFDYFLMHYFIERLLYRLSISEYAGNFILKGGLLLYAIFENDARATKDIDFLARRIKNTPEELTKIFAEISAVPSDDAVNFESGSISAERINEGADYQGVRIKLTGYLDRSRHVLQFDIGFGDAVFPKPVKMDYPSLLEMEQPHLQVYSLDSVIAEKFQAMIFLAEANSRMKDFYDIYKLMRSYNFEGKILYNAVLQTIKRRKTPLSTIPSIFKDEFADLKDKQVQWNAFIKRINAVEDLSFQDVISGIKIFMCPIYDCVLLDSEFEKSWNCTKGEWV